MALVTNHLQGSYTSFPTKPVLWNRGIKLKQSGITLPALERTDKFISLQCKCRPFLCVEGPLFLRPKAKLLKISCFKGISENEDSSGRAVGSKSLQNSVKLSYVSQNSEETLTELPEGQKCSVSSNSAVGDTSEGSQAIQNLFKTWLTLLRTPSPNKAVDKALEKPLTEKVPETQNGMDKKTERGGILRAVWCSFLGLDATITTPLVIFIPSYLAVNVVYGAEVSKELTPLWVLGPLIFALYIKMFRALCALYVFTFKQTVKVIKSLPTYYQMACSYTARAKLPVWDMKNLDYKEILKGKMKDLSFWLGEKYLDLIESIWPYYCRTLRFLKRANLL